ncbi:CLUMA_CG005225, isoform A [Clunio marinus]|uniref:CLUMA_CG005225, isoform A n=1 Tax=Clunio marinus TaxID=568069 RepID=A0A1J1HU93_9DIPT|nr:CLUMA_CG005225, isoform A [Clunio marinus]
MWCIELLSHNRLIDKEVAFCVKQIILDINYNLYLFSRNHATYDFDHLLRDANLFMYLKLHSLIIGSVIAGFSNEIYTQKFIKGAESKS